MNGNPDPNYPESGSTGAYSGTPGENAASGTYAAGQSGAGYTAPGAGYSGTSDAYAAPGYPPPPPGYVPPYGTPVPPPPVPGAPNPGLALLLGFIPGVGAMYNGQFAKGVAHIVIFAVLTKLAEHSDILGWLVAGWIFYMVLDAYQTARARRDGLVPPDPFGLNNIGERFGMPHNPNWGDFMARPVAGGASPADAAHTSNPYAGPIQDPAGQPTTAATSGYAASGYTDPSTGAPASAYAYVPTATGAPYGSPVPPASYPAGTVPPPWHPDYAESVRRQAVADAGVSSAAYQQAYTPFDPASMPSPSPVDTVSRIPMGAIWLIGLGVLALAGSLAHNFYWRGEFIGAASCFIFGTVLLVQQTSVTRRLYQPGTAAYQWSLLHQSRFGLTVLIVGVLQLLAGTHLTSWHYLWPYMLILFGLLQLGDRALYNRMLLEPPVFANGYAPVAPSGASNANAHSTSGSSSSSSTEGEVR